MGTVPVALEGVYIIETFHFKARQ